MTGVGRLDPGSSSVLPVSSPTTLNTHIYLHAGHSHYVMSFLSDRHCIGLCVLSTVRPTVCTKIILHESESPWPHATATALHSTWARFPPAIIHFQVPCQCSLTWSWSSEVRFQKSLFRPWVISEVSVSPSFSSPIHSCVSSFFVLALKLMTNEFCNTPGKLPQAISWGRLHSLMYEEGWGVEVLFLF